MAAGDHPLEVSSRVIDAGESDEATNRLTNELSELADDISIVESFSHVITFRTEDGLVCFDTSHANSAVAVTEALRTWSDDRVHSLVYTHGHIDHVGGSGAIAADAERRDHAVPAVVGHEAIAARFERYDKTNEYNITINARQFGNVGRSGVPMMTGSDRFLPPDTLWPTLTFDESLSVKIGDTEFVLHHDRGETDDHCWAWVPSRKALCVGDFVTWVFPNAGNPQKVQRYPLEWAKALRKMMAYEAELLLPAHGLPIEGTGRINRVLDNLAEALEFLVAETIAAMNAGAPLDEIIHAVKLPEETLKRPWMQPIYDEPEFVVRNIWRLYGGWWDLKPDTLKPSPRAVFASEVATLSGGVEVLAERAKAVMDAGDHRLACHLIELAIDADWSNRATHEARAEIYSQRRRAELSLMAKGIYAGVIRESRDLS
ncbi:MAG: MBL fold metallo-hydrolase [Acidobacteria bacterium]|nr:MBL fold metallo-hydrolase [Acidobacteriota bacterium]